MGKRKSETVVERTGREIKTWLDQQGWSLDEKWRPEQYQQLRDAFPHLSYHGVHGPLSKLRRQEGLAARDKKSDWKSHPAPRSERLKDLPPYRGFYQKHKQTILNLSLGKPVPSLAYFRLQDRKLLFQLAVEMIEQIQKDGSSNEHHPGPGEQPPRAAEGDPLPPE